jgi:plastocyanin
MKKLYFILFTCMAFLGTKAATFTISISGFAYTPSSLNCAIGDMVVIQASSSHPTAQVDLATWNANGTTPMAGGWGSKTTTFTFTATAAGTIYYVCQVHAGSGMKGQIIVNAAGVNETAVNFLKEYNVFPNPATTNIKVGFGLEENSTVNIKMTNVNGQEVKVFISDLNLPMGKYEYNFELPQGIAAGNYFIEVSSGNRKSTKKVLVTK